MSKEYIQGSRKQGLIKMDFLVVILGILFWPPVIIAWFRHVRKSNLTPWKRSLGTLFIVGIPMLGACSEGKYLFLDEPLVFAVRDGDAAKVKSLLAFGADPDASFKGSPALQQAAVQGNEDIVRLLLIHGAHTDVRDSWSHQTALESARINGYTGVVNLLQHAGATR